MRTGLVVFGAILLLGGVGVAFVAYPTMRDYETTAGQLVRAVSQDAQREYEEAVMMVWAGGCCGSIGFILLLVGLVAKDKNGKATQPPSHYNNQPHPAHLLTIPQQPPAPQPTPQYYVPQPPQPYAFQQTYCESCSTPIQPGWNLCPNCGKDL